MAADRSEFLASLVPAEINVQLTAVQNATPLRLLPSSEKLRHDLDQDVHKRFGKLHPHIASPAVTDRINKILNELKAAIPNVVSHGMRIAAEIKIYTVDGSQVNMESNNFILEDRNQAILGLILTEGALKLDGSALKAKLGHEFAHHLFFLTPDLERDPRFQPRSQAFKDEMAKLDAEAKKQAVPFFKERGITDPAIQETILTGWIKTNRQPYISELQADKLGLWLSKDTSVPLWDTSKENLSAKARDEEIKAIAQSDDIHPSATVRKAEQICTIEDMQKTEQAKRAPPPPQRQR